MAIILCGNSTAIAFDGIDLKKLEVLNACEECDLSGANLKGAILSGAGLKGAILSQEKPAEVNAALARWLATSLTEVWPK